MRRFLSALALLVSPLTICHAADFSLATNDESLIAHIKKTDYVFRTALGQCDQEKIERNLSGDTKRFRYTAHCAAVAADESDCPGYKVTATGTIDSDSWATLRSTTLELECRG